MQVDLEKSPISRPFKVNNFEIPHVPILGIERNHELGVEPALAE